MDINNINNNQNIWAGLQDAIKGLESLQGKPVETVLGADATNLTHLVHTSLEGLTRLVATAADAYVKVAGGGAQADTALTVAGRMISYFTGKGGDAAKATVSTDGSAVKVTDGTTTILCDKDGNCSDCTTGACNP